MKKHLLAIAERSTASFLYAFLGIILAFGTNTDKKALYAALVAGGLSVSKYLYSLTSAYLGSTSTQIGSRTIGGSGIGVTSITLGPVTLDTETYKAATAASPVTVDPVPAPAAA